MDFMPSFRKLVLTKPLITRKHNQKEAQNSHIATSLQNTQNELIPLKETNNGDSIECHGQKCDVHLKAGDTVYRKIKRHGNVYYCAQCFDKLWI